MKSILMRLSVLACASLIITAGGCPNLIPPQSVVVPLDNAAGGLQFAVTPGSPVQRTVTLTFDVETVGFSGGTIALDPDAVSIAAEGAEPGKLPTTLQGGSVTVVGRVALPDQEDDVCNSTDEYGPYTVSFDENFVVTGVNPSSITLSANTLAAMNTGTVTVCLEVDAPFTGTVTIESLAFNVSIMLN